MSEFIWVKWLEEIGIYWFRERFCLTLAPLGGGGQRDPLWFYANIP